MSNKLISKEEFLQAKKTIEDYKLQQKQLKLSNSKQKKKKGEIITLETWSKWNNIIKNI